MFVLPGLIGNTQRNSFDGTAAAKARNYLGHSAITSPGTSFSLDIGTAAADRNIIVCLAAFASDMPTATCTAAGVSLTERISNGFAEGFVGCKIYSGLVTTGSGSQTIAFSAGPSNTCQVYVWSTTGLSSNTPKATGSNEYGVTTAATIAVDAGDYLFAVIGRDGAINASWTGSTETITSRDATVGVGRIEGRGGDLTVASTNASFSVDSTGDSNDQIAAIAFA